MDSTAEYVGTVNATHERQAWTPWHPRVAISVALALLGLLPIANWLPGGHSAGWYGATLDGWLSGSAIAVGVGVVLAIFSRRLRFLWRDDAFGAATGYWTRRAATVISILAAASLALYVWVALGMFDGRPLLIDEVVQSYQAQILASGRLSLPAFAHPEFFSSMHLVDMQGRVYSQFPVGGPAMLMLGVLVHAPWLVNPVFGVLAVVAFAVYVRTTEPRQGNALGATAIFAFAPFVAIMSGSYMNHVTSMAWIMVAVAALASVIVSDEPRPGLAFLCGLGFGMAATIRPVDAFAFALPAGLWCLVRSIRDRRRWRDAFAAAAGVAIPATALMWVNMRTTGGPLLFGYEVLWGESHRLGFHSAPWGMAHTPARGIELINLYFLELQTYFLQTPVPSLLPAIGAIALSRRLDRFDRYMLTSSALVVGLYFAYWHNGFYLGPRFMYPLMPVLAIWTARFFPLVKERTASGFAYRATIYAAICAVVIALVVNMPTVAKRYSNGLLTMRWNADSAAAAAGIDKSLILVRESWGAQLVSRLWAMGVPRSETELIYRRTDACKLDTRIDSLERSGIRGGAAVESFYTLLGDSARLRGSPLSPDSTEQLLPGSSYTRRCIARINDDRAGFTLFTPLLLAHGGGNVYARDLHGRDTLLLQAYPNRKLYLLKPASAKIGEPPRFYPLSRDSLERAWRDPNR
ncbi:MAG TPA: hypothetical protein VFK04_09780 [Gemmatimonadaceae bacterium]|nr:hypothetical protein [Gemmatimonadaceae bacterium]